MHIQIADVGFLGVLLETLFHPVALAARKEGIWDKYKPWIKNRDRWGRQEKAQLEIAYAKLVSVVFISIFGQNLEYKKFLSQKKNYWLRETDTQRSTFFFVLLDIQRDSPG